MNRAERRRQQKLAKKAARNKSAPPAQTTQPTLEERQAIDAAIQLHTGGELAKAEAIYRQVLEVNPNQPIALHLLGVAAHQIGNNDIAVGLIEKSLAIDPSPSEAHFNLGAVLKKLSRLDESITSYRQAIAINPGYAEAHNNLGVNLQELNKVDEAISSYRKAIAIKPDYFEAHNNLGVMLKEKNDLIEAVSCFHKALALKPDYVEAHNNLGNALKELNQLEEASASYQRALSINPDYAGAHNNLGNTLKELNKLDEAISSFQRALTLEPDFTQAHDNILLSEQYRVGNTTQSLYPLHRDWEARHASVFRESWPDHQNYRDPERRLRVGFVSPDLGRHPVGYFVVGLMENLPQQGIETVIYSNGLDDDLTDRIKAATDIWHDVQGLSDSKLAEKIINDGIDILIDLAGHSANNRLMAFARKPAPVQVSWAGYVGTTGLDAMDYLLSDAYSTPPEDEPFYQEKVLRMPDGWLCYDPPDYAPTVGELPLRRNGYVTFGSFSNSAKINEDVVSVWAQILKEANGARLLIKYRGIDTGANTDRLTASFAHHGIDASRLILEGPSSHEDLLARYNDIDIALDPFPYSGGLTTFESLWMGVPVITVPGDTFASRHSQSHLSVVGLPELVASDKENYVNLCVDLAGDTERLEHLRLGLREKMTHSPLCDAGKFARNFAILMRNIWREWCLSST